MRWFRLQFLLLSLIVAVLAQLLSGCSDKSSDPGTTKLVGPTWRLTAIVNIKGVRTPATLEFFSTQFSASGKLSGTASCNSYSASYTLGESGELGIDSLATTLVYCGDGSLMDQYYAGLRAAHSYKISDSELTIYFAQQGELVFAPLGPD
ncbi:MAG: META domain-containing protein [bacterium]